MMTVPLAVIMMVMAVMAEVDVPVMMHQFRRRRRWRGVATHSIHLQRPAARLSAGVAWFVDATSAADCTS